MTAAMVAATGPPARKMAPEATSGPSYFSSPTNASIASRQDLPGRPAASSDSCEASTLRSARSKPLLNKFATARSNDSRSANRPTTSLPFVIAWLAIAGPLAATPLCRRIAVVA